jgi:aminoglycoside phosphotransferase (APT) family kinase protein
LPPAPTTGRAEVSDRRFDQPGAVRDEDGFDVGAVHRWLAERVEAVTGLGPPEVSQFPGGASNLTYLLRYPGLELVLRRPPRGEKAASAHDMGREYRVQKQLRPLFPYVPDVLALCEDQSVIGSAFYVMTRIEGMILRGALPDGLSLSEAAARQLGWGAIDCLVELHQVDPVAAGLADLGRGPGYVGRQVAGWTERYRRARTPNVPDFEPVMEWLAHSQPADVATCLIHNDFRLDNVVLDSELRVVGVLDWEMATLGDPLMDMGAVLAYWVQADDDELLRLSKRQPSDAPGMPTRAELAEYYGARTGRVVGNWVFYEVFGLFRLAAILQQIYYRFHLGQTTNPAFQDFWSLVTYLEVRCQALAHLPDRRP